MTPSPGDKPVGAGALAEAKAQIASRYAVIAVIALIGLAAGAPYGASLDGERRTEVRLGVFPLNENGTAVNIGVSAPVGPIAAEFLSDDVLDRLASATGNDADFLRKNIKVEGTPGDAHQIKLVAELDDPDEAEEVLSAWATAVLEDRTRVVRRQVSRAEEGLRDDLEDAETAAERKHLQENIAQLAAFGGSAQADVSVLRAPHFAGSPSGRPLLYAASGLIGGLVAGILLVLGWAVFEGTLRTAPALTARFGLPVVADLRSPEGREEAVERFGRLRDGETLHLAGFSDLDSEAARLLAATNEVELVGTLVTGWPSETGRGDLLIAVRPGETRVQEAAAIEPAIARAPEGVNVRGLVLV